VILVDTSIWIDHLRTGNTTLTRLLDASTAMIHPWVIGELALGNLGRRDDILDLLRALPRAKVADDDEVLSLIDREELYGSGVGYVDAQLLAATRLTSDTRLWTNDKALSGITARLGLGFAPPAL